MPLTIYIPSHTPHRCFLAMWGFCLLPYRYYKQIKTIQVLFLQFIVSLNELFSERAGGFGYSAPVFAGKVLICALLARAADEAAADAAFIGMVAITIASMMFACMRRAGAFYMTRFA